MSTIATQLNWGASYLVNDFYRRFVKPVASDKHYVVISQIATVLVTIGSAGVTSVMDSIGGMWQLLMALSAGTGGVLLLRWFWWRINAWSEISSMAASLICYLTLRFGFHLTTDDPKQAGAFAGPFFEDRALALGRARAGLEQLARAPGVDPKRLSAIGFCFFAHDLLQLFPGIVRHADQFEGADPMFVFDLA